MHRTSVQIPSMWSSPPARAKSELVCHEFSNHDSSNYRPAAGFASSIRNASGWGLSRSRALTLLPQRPYLEPHEPAEGDQGGSRSGKTVADPWVLGFQRESLGELIVRSDKLRHDRCRVDANITTRARKLFSRLALPRSRNRRAHYLAHFDKRFSQVRERVSVRGPPGIWATLRGGGALRHLLPPSAPFQRGDKESQPWHQLQPASLWVPLLNRLSPLRTGCKPSVPPKAASRKTHPFYEHRCGL